MGGALTRALLTLYGHAAHAQFPFSVVAEAHRISNLVSSYGPVGAIKAKAGGGRRGRRGSQVYEVGHKVMGTRAMCTWACAFGMRRLPRSAPTRAAPRRCRCRCPWPRAHAHYICTACLDARRLKWTMPMPARPCPPHAHAPARPCLHAHAHAPAAFAQVDHTTFKEPPELEDWLTHMGIDTRNWGKGTAKTVAELFGEVRTHAHAREQTISSISRPYHAR